MFDVLFGLFASKKIALIVAAVIAASAVFVFVYMYIERKEELEKRESERAAVVEREKKIIALQQRQFAERARLNKENYDESTEEYERRELERAQRRTSTVDDSDFVTVE